MTQHHKGCKTQSWMASQPPIRATPAEAQILPKQLDKPTVARPSKAQLLSGTSDKPQVVEAGPLDTVVKAIKLLAGLCISIIEWLTVDHCLYPSHAGHERVMFFGIFVPITIKRNLKAVLQRYSYIGHA